MKLWNFLVPLLVTVMGAMTVAESIKKGYKEPCNIIAGEEGGKKVEIDTCDASKKLKCQSGHCLCKESYQIYSYIVIAKNETLRRSKRSPRRSFKKSSGWKTKAAAAGVGGAFLGYQLGKANSNVHYNRHRDESKYERVYSCFTAVGGFCKLDLHISNVIYSKANNTVDYSKNENNETSTTRAPEPVAMSLLSNTSNSSIPPSDLDPNALPICVHHAVCNIRTSSNNVVEGNIRIGVCECNPGYTKTPENTCVSSSASPMASSFRTCVIICTSILPTFILRHLLLSISSYY